VKLWVISPVFPPSPGGFSDYTRRWLVELRRQWEAEDRSVLEPLQLTLITRSRTTTDSSIDLYPRQYGRGPIGMARLLAGVVRARPDAIVIQYDPFQYERHGLSFSINLMAAALRVAGIPVATMAHELYYWRHERFPYFLIGLAQRIALLPLFWGSRLVGLTTMARMHRMERVFPWWTERFRFLPVSNTMDPRPLSDCASLRDSFGVSQSALLLLHLGLPHADKSVTALERSLDRLRLGGIEAQLAVVGGARVDHPNALNLGFLPPSDVASLLACADACLLPFDDGVSGRRSTFLNALASALPSIGTIGSNTDSTIENAGALELVPAGDPDAFADAVYKFARSPVAERAALGAAARELYERHFAWPLVAQSWITALAELTNR
jgi:glycosyltransferase involved in cell wall biosynthesis